MSAVPLLAEFVRLQPAPSSHRVALRAGVCFTVPLLLVVWLGEPSWTPYAAFGAFVSLYARYDVQRSRAAMQFGAGVGLLAAVVAGAVVAAMGASDWLLVGAGALVAGVGTGVSTTLGWHPPGSLFMVFAYGAVASTGGDWSDVPTAFAVTAASGAFAFVVSNPGVLAGRYRQPDPRPRRPVPLRGPVGSMLAAVLAGAVAALSGVGHPDWAMVAAVAPLSAAGLGRQVLRAGHRVVGTIVGLVAAAPLLGLALDPVPRVFVLVLLMMATELVVGRNYGLAMVFITPMALLMVQLAAQQPDADLLFDRGVQTVIGGVAAVAVVTLMQRVGRRDRRRRPSSSSSVTGGR